MRTLFNQLLAMVIVAAGVGFANGQENGFKAGDKISLKIAGVPANEVQLVSGFYTVGDGGTLTHWANKKQSSRSLRRSIFSSTLLRPKPLPDSFRHYSQPSFSAPE
ncbi:MAG: hypothetical protein P8J87_05370, partial [Verrucomicrobiales bacterium]|nr:hypothetical protein [Verrucomicrobiales bacterium]